MLLGHVAAGIAGKKINPKVSLWILIPLALIPDILAIPFIIFPSDQIDRVFLTHGLLMNVGFALLAGVIALIVSRKFRTGVLITMIVFSHWILDFITWPMEGRGLPIYLQGSTEVGLGMYTGTTWSIIGELLGLIAIIALLKFKVDKSPK